MSWRKGSQPNARIWRKVRVKVLERDGWMAASVGDRGGLR